MDGVVSDNLKQKAITGVIWKFLEQGGTQLIQFLAGIYIARILSPDDYGLIGMMAIFLGISIVFIDSGFRSTLIQKGNSVTQADYNTIFYFNLSVSVFFYILIYWGAPSIAQFYDEPRLTIVARIIGINLILMSLGMIHQIIFEKKINFKTISKINLIATFISACSGIILAVMGFGVWALVSMFLVESLIRSMLLWIINKWRPNLEFSLVSLKTLLPMGSKLLFAGILNQFSQNIFSLAIGKLFTTGDVGFYSQAKKLQQRIGDIITYSIQGVLLPVQSLLKEDIPRLKNAVQTNVKITSLIAFPAIFGLMAVARPFIILALTDKWLPSVYYVYILSISGFFFVLSSAIGSYLLPIGKVNFIVKIGIFSNILLLVLIALGVLMKVDLKLLILGKALQEFLVFIVTVYYANRFIKYRFIEVMKDIAPVTLLSLFMGAFVFYLGEIFGTSILVLGLQVFCGIGLYVIGNYIFNRKLFTEIFRYFVKQRK